MTISSLAVNLEGSLPTSTGKYGNAVIAIDDAPPSLEILSYIEKHPLIFLLLFFSFSCFAAGPLLAAWLTDNVFGSPAPIDQSLALAPPAMLIIGLVLVFWAVKPYRNMVLKPKWSPLKWP